LCTGRGLSAASIYAFRSKIVHGDADLDKHRQIARGGAKIRTIDAAVEHLRSAFAVLLKHSAFLEPANIDKFLLTNKLHEDIEA